MRCAQEHAVVQSALRAQLAAATLEASRAPDAPPAHAGGDALEPYLQASRAAPSPSRLAARVRDAREAEELAALEAAAAVIAGEIARVRRATRPPVAVLLPEDAPEDAPPVAVLAPEDALPGRDAAARNGGGEVERAKRPNGSKGGEAAAAVDAASAPGRAAGAGAAPRGAECRGEGSSWPGRWAPGAGRGGGASAQAGRERGATAELESYLRGSSLPLYTPAGAL